MPKNNIKAKNTRPGSNKKTGRDYSKEKEYQSSPERKKYRAFLNKMNRKAGKYGNGDGMDYDHDERRFMRDAKNRAKK